MESMPRGIPEDLKPMKTYLLGIPKLCQVEGPEVPHGSS